ncbi:MAG: hypothetical protein ISS41_11715 [Candidatus Aminicenantes bacterium]|nr:hypothetical protein [Candidatus Aminicenantes bacterium]
MITRLIFFLFLIWFWAIPSEAIDQSGQLENHIQRLEKTLKLSREQVDHISAILADAQKKAQKEKDQYKGYHRALLLADENLRKTVDNQIMTILTPEQRTKYRKISEPQPMDKHLMELKKKLSLTDVQMQEIEPIFTSTREMIAEIAMNSSGDLRMPNPAIKKIMDKQAKNIEKVLTREQKEKFKELRKKQEEQMLRGRPQQ